MISRTDWAFSPSLFSLNAFDVGRRRRRRRAEDVLENPRAAQHRRRAVGVRRGQQHAALAEQPPAIRIGQRHAAELLAAHVRNAVVQRQPLVHERVVRGQQVEHAAVLAHDALDEQLDLFAESPRAGRRRSSGTRPRPARLRRAPRIFSHWNAKLVTSDVERGSASSRRTCASSTFGSASVPFSARRSSSSSGGWPSRKNESRDARSRIVMRCTAPGAVPAAYARRDTGTSGWRESPAARPGCRRRSRRSARGRSCRTPAAPPDPVGDRTTERPARQRREDRRRARQLVGRGLSGRQTKMRWRLGVSLSPPA